MRATCDRCRKKYNPQAQSDTCPHAALEPLFPSDGLIQSTSRGGNPQVQNPNA